MRIIKAKNPLISIIIVTYQAELHLECAIRSVLDQNYRNIELIVIDGGSSDRTLDILKKYESNIAHLVSEIDEGIYDAMTKGVKLAKGEWLYFLGADDVLVNCLHKVIPCLKNRHTIYYGDVYLPNKNKTYAGKFKWHTLVLKNINHQSIFYPDEVFSHYQFNRKYKILADYDLNIRCWGDGKFKFKYLPFLIAIHNDEGLSHQEMDESFLEDKPVLIAKYFRQRLALRNGLKVFKSNVGKLIHKTDG